MELFITQMYRWGSEEGHSYILGVWDTQEEAEKNTKEHVRDRDGKYDGVVFRFELNKVRAWKAVCTYRGIGCYDRVEGFGIGDLGGKVIQNFQN